MAKANTSTKKDKTKRSSSKKAKHAASQSQPDAAPKKSGGKTSKKATAKAGVKADKAKASDKTTATKAAASKAANKTSAAAEPQAATAGTLDSALLPAQSGKVGVFGGPKDRGIKPDDMLALPTGRHFTLERVRSLNPKSFYCAMRWDYHVNGNSIGEGQRWWANKKLLVTNPANGAAIVVRAVDFGPPESTGLAIAVSPGAAEALGVEVGDEVEIAFADPHLPTGAVE